MVLGYMCRILWSQHSMKSEQASQAKHENNTIKRSGPRMTLCRKIAADCAKEGRIVKEGKNGRMDTRLGAS